LFNHCPKFRAFAEGKLTCKCNREPLDIGISGGALTAAATTGVAAQRGAHQTPPRSTLRPLLAICVAADIEIVAINDKPADEAGNF